MASNTIVTIFLCSFWATITFAQSNYDDYTKSSYVFNDDFSTNNNKWPVGKQEGNCDIWTYYEGYYQMQSVCTGTTWATNINQLGRGFSIDSDRDFEIEAAIAWVSGKDNGSNNIDWGQGGANYFSFGFSGRGKFYISKMYNGAWVHSKNWTASSAINKTDYNRLTIRKMSDYYYFFINKVLVHSSPFEPFFGQNLGIYPCQNSTIRIDYVSVAYISKVKRVVAG